ncbi:MAG: cation:proton antiporter, partial [Candidatus Dormibacteraeota bacterium]|nr:cation:proton antiporter [Candidatus Dormibacteraeota bacterium]
SRIDLGRLRRGLGLPVRLLGVGLPLTIAAGTLAGLSALPGLTVAEALILAIVLAPTDAALGQAVVTDRRLPARIRQALNVESGLNDGICVPLLFIALAAAEAEDRLVSGSQAVHIVFQEIGGGLAGGVVAGLAGAFAVRLAVKRGLGEGSWIQVIPAATALLAYGLSAIPGGSGFIAAFVAGLVFGGLEKTGARQVTSLVDDAGEFLDAITLALFGAVLLGPLLGELSWRSLLYAALSLTLVRMAPVALALLGSGAALPTVGFLGWFGPRGLASIVFAITVVEESRLPQLHPMLAAISATIGLSIAAHGLTARPLTERYARWYQRHSPAPAMEGLAVMEHRWRRGSAG